MSMKSAGALLGQARGRRTQPEIARLAKCSTVSYARLERGEVGRPNCQIVYRVCMALGIDPGAWWLEVGADAPSGILVSP